MGNSRSRCGVNQLSLTCLRLVCSLIQHLKWLEHLSSCPLSSRKVRTNTINRTSQQGSRRVDLITQFAPSESHHSVITMKAWTRHHKLSSSLKAYTNCYTRVLPVHHQTWQQRLFHHWKMLHLVYRYCWNGLLSWRKQTPSNHLYQQPSSRVIWVSQPTTPPRETISRQ